MDKKLRIFIACALIGSVIAVSGYSGRKNESLTLNTRYAQNQTDNIKVLADNLNSSGVLQNKTISVNIPDEYKKVAENSKLELYLNEQSLGLKIRNIETGYVWSSVLDHKDEDLNKTWQGFAASGVTLEYIDNFNKIKQAAVTIDKPQITVAKNDSGFTANIEYGTLGFKLSLAVTLEDDGIDVQVPYSSIQETDKNYKIQSLYVYPFFGAIKGSDEPGYMFIPDGSGALIRTDRPTLATQPYISRVYGQDLGMTGVDNSGDNSTTDNQILARPTEQIYMPVFGIADKNNAFLASIESGDPYTELRAYASGITTKFNWTCAKFIYREQYFKPVDKKGNGITVNQEARNKFNAELRYMFLSNNNASYVGMAKRYQAELVEKGILKKQDNAESKDVPVKLDFLAADNKKELLWKKVIPMATVSQIDSILGDLQSNTVSSMSVTVRGWTKGGVTGSSPMHFPFEGKVGSQKDWTNLIQKYKAKNIPIYMYSDYLKAYTNGKGYKDANIAQSISEQLINFNDVYSFMKPDYSAKLFSSDMSKFSKYGMNYIAIDTLGKNLLSTYNKNDNFTRSNTLKVYQSMFNANNKYAFYSPNAYLWKNTGEYLNIPMGSSNFMLETDTVPFMQIVLKGYMDYFAPPSNFNANTEDSLLQMIDYGCLPTFDLTNEDPVKLIDTGSNWLYTSQYSVWKDEIIKEYTSVNEALKPVRNAAFENREVIKDGIVKNTYSNGTTIIINYTDEDYVYNNTTISPKNFTVIKGD